MEPGMTTIQQQPFVVQMRTKDGVYASEYLILSSVPHRQDTIEFAYLDEDGKECTETVHIYYVTHRIAVSGNVLPPLVTLASRAISARRSPALSRYFPLPEGES